MKDYRIGTLLYKWPNSVYIRGLQHVQCTNSVIMPILNFSRATNEPRTRTVFYIQLVLIVNSCCSRSQLMSVFHPMPRRTEIYR